jgi:hypothetical protein
MTFNFSALGTARPALTLTDPRQLFEALPNRAEQYEFLRDAQGQVLEEWYRRRDEKDTVLKMNTGGGKTVVGLLACQSSLNEGFGPALYIAPDPYLADQAIQQGRELGLAVTDNPASTKFASGDAICVTSILRLVNGKSVFGLDGGVRPVVDVGTVVIDDAHAAIKVLEEQTTLVVRSGLTEYDEILTLFEDDLRKVSASTFLDIKDGVRSAVLPVPFWAWQTHLDAATSVLRRLRDDEQVQWTWPLVKELLPICQVVLTSDALEVRPPCPPIEKIASFHNARRRVYLTATLADDSVLVTHFDADPATVARPITPAGGGQLGDRLILAPQEITPSITDDTVRRVVRTFADEGHNVVVLVPSHRRATLWSEYADATAASAEQIAQIVARLRAGHVGLAVMVNKYDGIDLPDRACRVLVVDGLPEAYGGGERRERVVLGDSDAMVTRQLQRIEQGMGRGVRSSNDFCVVLLLGSRLSQLVASPAHRGKLGPATRAQVDLSREVASSLEGRSMSDLAEVMRQVLGRDPGWVAQARGRLAGVTFGPGKVTKAAIGRREAFNHASVAQYPAAAKAMSDAVNAAVDDRQKGWLQEQLAAYQHFTDAPRAQQTLAGALKLNRYVLRPRAGVSYRRISSGAVQAAQSANFLGATYPDVTSLRLGVDTMLDDLDLDPERVPEFEDAMARLGEHLGFAAQRPERDTGTGPDVLWAIGGLRYLVIEAKSGATADRIWRKDVEQLSHSMNWFGEQYDSTCEATPVLVHRTNLLEHNATPPPGTRVITEGRLRDLRTAVSAVTRALAESGRWADSDAVAEQLREHDLLAGGFADRFAVQTARL